MNVALVPLTCLLLVAAAPQARGELPLVDPASRVIARDRASGDAFGIVATDGPLLVVGAPSDDDDAPGSGSVYVYRFDGIRWRLEAKLRSPTPAAGDAFGTAVDVSGERVIVLARNYDGPGPDLGAVFLFKLDGSDWVFDTQLVAPDIAGEERVLDVALDGDVAVLQRQYRNENEFLFGGVATFVHESATGWTLRQITPVQNGIDGFAMRDGLMVVGRRQINLPFIRTGDAVPYVWNGTTWDRLGLLEAGELAPYPDHFGTSVAISGLRVAVGAPGFDGTSNVGLAVVFRRDGTDWVREARIRPSDAVGNDGIGSAVALAGDALVVHGSHATYVHGRCGTSWPERQKLARPDGETDLQVFALNGSTAFAGATGADTDVPSSGAVFVYATGANAGRAFCLGDGSAATCPCGASTLPASGCAGTVFPEGATLSGFGTASVSADSVVLTSCGLPAGAPTLFFQGVATASAAPFGDGLLCIAAPVRRLGSGVATDGVLSFPGDGPGLAARGHVTPGATIDYQSIYRGPAGSCTGAGFNLSNGWTVVWTP